MAKRKRTRCFGQTEGPAIQGPARGWTPMTGVIVGVIAGVIVQFIATRYIKPPTP